jgi:hypothetical protein
MHPRQNRVSEKPARFDAHACWQSIHPVMAIFGHTSKAGVRVVESRGIHCAYPLASTLGHSMDRCRCLAYPPLAAVISTPWQAVGVP